MPAELPRVLHRLLQQRRCDRARASAQPRGLISHKRSCAQATTQANTTLTVVHELLRDAADVHTGACNTRPPHAIHYADADHRWRRAHSVHLPPRPHVVPRGDGLTASTTTTDARSLAASRAQARPPLPPPMTTRLASFPAAVLLTVLARQLGTVALTKNAGTRRRRTRERRCMRSRYESPHSLRHRPPRVAAMGSFC